MKKLLLISIISFIFNMQLFPAAVTKYYDQWKVKNITYDETTTKTVTISMNIEGMVEVYIASRSNQFNITLTWYNENIDENTPLVQYKFDDSQYYSVEPAMRSSKDKFDILYTISPAFGLVQEKETISFLKELINKNTLYIRPNNYGEDYSIDLSGLKEALENTDFSGTLFDKYKSSILN